jgi:hypothetical protein
MQLAAGRHAEAFASFDAAAALMREKAKAKGAYAKEKAWAAGMEKPAKPAGAKVAQDS